jgi:hypothetical protein
VVASSRTVLQTQLSNIVEHRNLEHWFLDKQGKLLAWREWRSQLSAMDTASAFKEAAEWWKFVPLVNKTFDPWRIETWPNPWELVSNGSFCQNAQGLGMFYSLVLSGIDCRLLLAVVEDQPRLMVLLDNNKLLNYYDGEIVDVESVEIQIVESWAPSDLARLVKV